MKRRAFLSMLAGAVGFAHSARADRNEVPVIVVTGPTVVAFFTFTDSEMKGADTNEVLSDFQLYASQVAAPLKERGIEFHQVYARSFRLKLPAGGSIVTPKKNSCGYYFIVPGKEAHVDYGVMTDGDILAEATKYL